MEGDHPSDRDMRIAENMLPPGGETYLSVGGVSRHTQPETYDGTRLNESNPGLGLMYQWKDGDISKFVEGGQYRNSYDKDSYYVAGGLKKRLLGGGGLHLDAGFLGGVITGYPTDPMFAAMPMLSVEGSRGAIDLMYAPRRGEGTSETFMLNGRLKLK